MTEHLQQKTITVQDQKLQPTADVIKSDPARRVRLIVESVFNWILAVLFLSKNKYIFPLSTVL